MNVEPENISSSSGGGASLTPSAELAPETLAHAWIGELAPETLAHVYA